MFEQDLLGKIVLPYFHVATTSPAVVCCSNAVWHAMRDTPRSKMDQRRQVELKTQTQFDRICGTFFHCKSLLGNEATAS